MPLGLVVGAFLGWTVSGSEAAASPSVAPGRGAAPVPADSEWQMKLGPESFVAVGLGEEQGESEESRWRSVGVLFYSHLGAPEAASSFSRVAVSDSGELVLGSEVSCVSVVPVGKKNWGDVVSIEDLEFAFSTGE